MLAASFVTLLYWAAFGLVAGYVLLLVGQERERRDRVRRMRERRQRRALRDETTPRRWTT